MSESDTKIECARHGSTVATFVCRHLERGQGCGFHDSEAQGDRWPDAWCDKCQAILDRDGHWTDENLPMAEMAVLCTGCYEEVRANNARVPPPIRPGQLAVSDAEYAAFAHAAHLWCERRQADARVRWAFDRTKKWFCDQDAGVIRLFDSEEGVAVVADIDVVGSWSTRSQSWLWSWGNDGYGWPERRRIEPVAVFGEVRGIKKLAEAHWQADEIDGWEVTQMAAYLLGAEAVYRAPMNHLHVFMLLRNFRAEPAATRPLR